MQIPLVTLAGLLLLLPSAAQESKRVPQGIRDADKAEAAFEKNVPPPIARKRKIATDLKDRADELSTLAQSIPADVKLTDAGILPKEVLSKLKRIEKLSKQIRTELAP